MRYIAFLMIILLHACKPASELKKVQVMSDYPSGSALAGITNATGSRDIYLAGDDARYVLVMNNALQKADSINIFGAGSKRIDKLTKPDIEAMASIQKTASIFMIGSGSLDTMRNVGYFLDVKTRSIVSVRLDTFYDRLRKAGIRDLNIEGITAYPGGFILSSRGHLSYRRNHLIFTSANFWLQQKDAPINVAAIGTNADTTTFNGVSGLEYSFRTDKLYLSVSTEMTSSVLEDGEIGKSYIWVVNDIYAKRNYTAMNPSAIIDLEEIDSRFTKQKIESLTLVKDSRKNKRLLLVSDDDKGGSVLFELQLDK